MKLELTTEQFHWIDAHLRLWGAWTRTGRIDKPMMNMIAKFMATVQQQPASQPMCNDDDGLLISEIIRVYLKNIDENAWRVLFAYYVCDSSEIRIATWQHAICGPRLMRTRGENRYKKPSISTIRREVKEQLNASLFCLYQPLQNAFNEREILRKSQKMSKFAIAF